MQSPNEIIQLYDGPAPGSETWTHEEEECFSEEWQTQVVFNVTSPTLTVFRPQQTNGTAVVICPGGAYHGLSINSEGFDVAHWLTARGVTAFVLKYRLVQCHLGEPAKDVAEKPQEQLIADMLAVRPLAAADGQVAMRYVRAHAQTYSIQPDRIGMMGFSAGGSVTVSVGFQYTPESRPDFLAPIYAAYRLADEPVPDDAPPAFILAATDDPLELAPHSVALYNAWTNAGKSAELHLYSTGGHGFGMKTQNLPSDRWIDRFGDWLEVQGLL
ncbi:MAG: alpha/beta hydrolase [Chloroflexota bacterium]